MFANLQLSNDFTVHIAWLKKKNTTLNLAEHALSFHQRLLRY